MCRPILNPQPIDAAEMIGIIRHQDQIIRKGGCGDSHVEIVQTVAAGCPFRL